ncbi:hypothetical protein KPC_2332 [Acinetobacter stercoris]|uniref:Uncharacterized protein n=1 Tax=Acinetobacter stercoris TaxID=2126983 RepID=A0A2U3N0I0_9GAMM|nr:hypothetical protein KPC_2332 [Acinetobacter stercoris]
MRSRHASMSFIISVEANNIPKVQRNHIINAENYDEYSQHLLNELRLIT